MPRTVLITAADVLGSVLRKLADPRLDKTIAKGLENKAKEFLGDLAGDTPDQYVSADAASPVIEGAVLAAVQGWNLRRAPGERIHPTIIKNAVTEVINELAGPQDDSCTIVGSPPPATRLETSPFFESLNAAIDLTTGDTDNFNNHANAADLSDPFYSDPPSSDPDQSQPTRKGPPTYLVGENGRWYCQDPTCLTKCVNVKNKSTWGYHVKTKHGDHAVEEPCPIPGCRRINRRKNDGDAHLRYGHWIFKNENSGAARKARATTDWNYLRKFTTEALIKAHVEAREQWNALVEPMKRVSTAPGAIQIGKDRKTAPVLAKELVALREKIEEKETERKLNERRGVKTSINTTANNGRVRHLGVEYGPIGGAGSGSGSGSTAVPDYTI